MWVPSKVDALSIVAAMKHFRQNLIQSTKKAYSTDSKPCVQAYEKPCQVEFSASPYVSNFLVCCEPLSRFSQACLRHCFPMRHFLKPKRLNLWKRDLLGVLLHHLNQGLFQSPVENGH